MFIHIVSSMFNTNVLSKLFLNNGKVTVIKSPVTYRKYIIRFHSDRIV